LTVREKRPPHGAEETHKAMQYSYRIDFIELYTTHTFLDKIEKIID
jgi:hypothetical protein